MPKVTVCIPVYNVEKYIERCAVSLFGQTMDDLEFVFVDDCTPDRSIEVLTSVMEKFRLRFAEKKYTARIERMPSNSGQAAVRRHGIQLAAGDYITFCDSDDTMPEDAIESLYRLAIETGADVASGDMLLVYDDGTTKRSYISLPHGNDRLGVYRALLSKDYSHTLCCKLFKSNLLQEHDYVTLLHATNGEDGMLFYQVLQHAIKVVHQNKVVYDYFQHTQSSTHVRLKEHALYSIIQLNKIRLTTCGRIDSLKESTWIYVSQVLNGLIGDGYNKKGLLKNLIHQEKMDDFINPWYMFIHYPIKEYVKTMGRRLIKPLILRAK